jgi:tripartite-type tricarboxylate transporter receptor subunit TctC
MSKPFSMTRRSVSAGSALIASLIAMTVFATAAQAQSANQAWPVKPVKLIVNFPPGSSPDVIARALSVPLQEALGQPVVLENRAGASGMIGGDAVAKAPADGYTLLMTAGSTMAISPSISKMPFDPVKDLTPVAATARILLFLVARAGLPPKNIAEFLSYAKANPGKLTYGSAGSGTGLHIAGEMLKSQAGIFAVHIPYRGAAPALQDLLAGQIDFYFDPGIALGHVRSGRLRMLAAGSPRRSSLFPDVPTLDEIGLRGFDAGTTHGVYAPMGTPPEIVARINREINRILGLPAMRSVIAGLGAESTPLSPAEYGAKMQEDAARYAVIIRERKIREE